MSWLLLALITVIGFICNFIQVYRNNLPPTWFWTLPDPDQRFEYFYLHLYKPWTHLSVYAIAIGCGLFCADQKKASSNEGPYGKNVTRLIGWLFVAVVSVFLIFSQHEWVLGNLPDAVTAGLYDGFHRIVWAICHCIMMYFLTADLEEENSLTRTLLGNKGLIVFGRLSLTAYVIHPIVELLFFGTQQTHIFSSPVTIVSCLESCV
jgi:peptidoglycan/LPS O-acetylase OafA/YrhL